MKKERRRCMWCGAKHEVGSSIQKLHDGYLKDQGVVIQREY